MDEIIDQLCKEFGVAREQNTQGNQNARKCDLSSVVKVMKAAFSKFSNEKDKQIEMLQREVHDLKCRLDREEKNRPTFAQLFSNEKGKKPSEEAVQVISSLSRETRETEKKQKNVVIFGIAESKKSVATEKSAEDLEVVKEIIGATTRSKKIEIKKVHRLRSNVENKPGPVVVELSSKEDRDLVLKSARNLKENENFREVFVNEDMTLIERLKHKELIRERNEKNQKLVRDENGRFNGSHYFGIRNGRVVELAIRA